MAHASARRDVVERHGRMLVARRTDNGHYLRVRTDFPAADFGRAAPVQGKHQGRQCRPVADGKCVDRCRHRVQHFGGEEIRATLLK